MEFSKEIKANTKCVTSEIKGALKQEIANSIQNGECDIKGIAGALACPL